MCVVVLFFLYTEYIGITKAKKLTEKIIMGRIERKYIYMKTGQIKRRASVSPKHANTPGSTYLYKMDHHFFLSRRGAYYGD